MSLVRMPLASFAHDPSGSVSGRVMRAMEWGQFVITAALVVIGAVRAIAAGTDWLFAVLAGVTLLVCYGSGAGIIGRVPAHRAVALRWWLIGFALVWCLTVLVSAEFVWVAFVLWLLAGQVLPGRWAILYSLLVYSVVGIAPVLHYGATHYANVFGPLIGGIFALGISRGYLELLRQGEQREILLRSLTQAQQEMAELQDDLVRAQREAGAVAERSRIARDIHDTVAQTLSSMRLITHAAIARAAAGTDTQTLQQIEVLAGEGLSDVRRIIAALTPAELDEYALSAALARVLERAETVDGVHAELHLDETVQQLDVRLEVALLRTVQSALANVRQHAQAQRVVVSVTDTGETVRLDIRDDGLGFDVAAWEAQRSEHQSSYGLRFMRNRWSELGGGLEIESVMGEGTVISAFAPLRRTLSDADSSSDDGADGGRKFANELTIGRTQE